MCGTAVITLVHLFMYCSLCAPTKQIPLYTFSRLQGKTHNGGGSGWNVKCKELFDNLQEFVRMDCERDSSLTQAGGDGIMFNKALYQRYLQCKDNESNTNCGNNPDKQSKQNKPVYHDEFEDESDEEDTLQNSAAICSE
jgi:hypothetical protein